MENKKAAVIDLPLKMIFTDEGINFFIRSGKKLNKFKLANEVEQYGVFLERFSPPSIQRMLHIGYISDVEISRPEFLSKRQDVMDLSKIITYGNLYHRFDEVVFEAILESALVKRWNRTNPGSIIDQKTKLSEKYLQEILTQNKKHIQAVKQECLKPIISQVMADKGLDMNEKNIQLFLGEKYLDNLRPMSWFILSKFKDDPAFDTLLTELRDILQRYMEKAQVAEYLALITMELLLYAGNKNIQKFVMKRYKGTMDPDTVILDEEMRKMLVNEMIQRGDNIYLSWKMSTEKTSLQSRTRLQLSIYNNASDYTNLKNNIDNKKGLNIKRKSLTDFYRDVSQEGGSSDLGLYYLSYLSEECTKVGIHFESLVSQIKESEQSVITLSIFI